MTTATLQKTDRQIASDLVERMPESATLDEIREELAILAAIRAARVSIAAGESMSHDEAMRRSAPWITQ